MSGVSGSTTARRVPSGPSARLAAGAGFGWLWLGEGVSLLGNATTAVLLPLLAVGVLHAGPAWMGVITASAWLPWLLVGLPAGALVDRLPVRGVMIAADLVSAAALGTVPVAAGFGVLTLGQLAAVAFTGGTAGVFFRAAYVKLIPLVVPDAELERANARLFGTESTAQVAGSGVAGALLSVVSVASALLLDVASFLVSAFCLRRVRPRAAAATGPAVRVPLTESIREGVRVVVGDRYLRSFTVVGGLSNFGLTGYQALLVLFLVRTLGLGSALVGVVLAVGAVGGPVGAAVAPRLARRLGSGRASTVLLLMAAPSALLIALPTSAGGAWLTVLGLVAVSATVVGGNVVRGAWRQRYVPGHLLGRVMTTSQLLNYGTMPLAAVAAGVIASSIGVRETMLLMAGVHAAACVGILLTGFATARQLPTRIAGRSE